MNKTTQAPYNISASLASGYMPLGPLDVPSCNEAGRLETSTFNFWELRRNTVINFQFDSKTLNATVYANGTDMVINMDKKISGVLKITMTGVIDPWHSDFLSDNSTTPSWKRTVGYDENYYGYDFSSGAMSRNSETAVSIAAALFSTVLMLI
ncbi:hypothetical protein N7448_004285 [Penicillium atrosanguineum]|nr:hypothetical protein N7526_011091 [Penicillium atrosanguineum]KAJ5140877.1 hypothetical protein N7448_004285 [Penicillium atrosanguineum]